jgi:hypothetical protein
MKSSILATTQPLRREWKYARKYAFAWDFRSGVVVGLGVFFATHFDKHLGDQQHLLDVCVLLGIAILTVVMAAISIFAVFLTEDYGIVLRYQYRDDVGEAFYPYRLIAFISCLTTFVSAFGLFMWPVAHGWERQVVVGLSLGLATWATLGTFDLVRITAGHGVLKVRTPELGKDKLTEMEQAASHRDVDSK